MGPMSGQHGQMIPGGGSQMQGQMGGPQPSQNTQMGGGGMTANVIKVK